MGTDHRHERRQATSVHLGFRTLILILIRIVEAVLGVDISPQIVGME